VIMGRTAARCVLAAISSHFSGVFVAESAYSRFADSLNPPSNVPAVPMRDSGDRIFEFDRDFWPALSSGLGEINANDEETGISGIYSELAEASGTTEGFLRAEAQDRTTANATLPSTSGRRLHFHRMCFSNFEARCPRRSVCTGGSPELCFCQLAGNRGCKSPCVCPSGCTNVTWAATKRTATFKNKKRSRGCGPSSEVLLTVPKTFVKDTHDLKENACKRNIVKDLLKDSFEVWQTQVASGPVHQCFHSRHSATVKYLHLQTFCGEGRFHGMPTHERKVAACIYMREDDELDELTDRLLSKI